MTRHEREVEGHVALVVVAKVGANVGRPHVGFGEDEAVFVLGIERSADLLNLDVRFGDVLATGAVALDEVGDGVQAEAVHAHVHPEAHGVEDFFHHARVVEVQVGLVREEAMPVVLLRDLVPGPVGFFGVGEDDADAFVELVGVRPDVHLAFGRALWRAARGLEPRVLIGRVIDDELDHHLHVAGVGFVEKLLEVGEGAVGRIDVRVVGDVVTVVTQGRREEREQPEAGDAELLQVVELGDKTLEVADPVAVGVGKGAHVQLIDDGVFVPERVCGAAGFLHSCLSVRGGQCCWMPIWVAAYPKSAVRKGLRKCDVKRLG